MRLPAYLALALAFAAPAHACEMALASKLPVQAYGSDLLVPMSLNGKPAQMIFDSGAYYSLITEAAATRVGLRVMRREEYDASPTLASGIGGSRSALEMTARSVELGGIKARDFDFTVADFLKPPVDGLLSLSLIAQFDIDFDLSENEIRLFRPKGDCSAPAAFLSQPLYVVPLRPTGLDRRPRIRVQIGSTSLVALVDTGAAHSAIFRGPAERIGLRLADLKADQSFTVHGVGSERVRAVRHAIEPVSIGDLEFSNMRLDVLDDRPGDEVEMLLGADFVRAVHIWISYSSHSLILQYPPHASKKAG